jgi:hypothetical protein
VPCWPDLWERARHLLPLLGVLASLVAYIAVVALLLWAPKLRKRWQLITSRILGGVMASPLVVALPAILLGLALAGGNPPTQTRIVRSSDGQEANLSYDAGFLGRDYTEISLKRTGCCRHIVVFWHNGPSWFDDAKIEWLDNRHLHLTYHARENDPQHCEHQVKDVTIVCTSLPFPKGPSDPQASPGPPEEP